MELDLRQAIIQQVQDKSIEDLHGVIQDSIRGQEMLLPGLGVLFELIWEHSAEDTRKQLVQTLKEHLPSPVK